MFSEWDGSDKKGKKTVKFQHFWERLSPEWEWYLYMERAYIKLNGNNVLNFSQTYTPNKSFSTRFSNLYIYLIFLFKKKTLNICSKPAAIYLFKVNNGNTRTMYGICEKLTIKTSPRCLYCYLWTYFLHVSVVSIFVFEKVNACWKVLWWLCSKLAVNATERSQLTFFLCLYFNFKNTQYNIQHISFEFLFLTMSRYFHTRVVSEQANTCSKQCHNLSNFFINISKLRDISSKV